MKRVPLFLFLVTGLLLAGSVAVLAADGRGSNTSGQSGQATGTTRGAVAIAQTYTRDNAQIQQGQHASTPLRSTSDRDSLTKAEALAIRLPRRMYPLQHVLRTSGDKRRKADKEIRTLIRRLDVDPL